MGNTLSLLSSPLLLVPVIAYLVYAGYQRCLCKPIPGIPYNKDAANTLLGDLPKILKAAKDEVPLFSMIAAHTTKLNSPVIQFFLKPCSKPWVIVSDFKETQDILLRRTKDFDRSEATADLFATVAPGFHMNHKSNSETFKMNRNLLKDLMTPAFLNQVAAPQAHASVSKLVELWSLKARSAQNRPFDAFQDIFDIMLDSISAITFGLNVNESITATRIEFMNKSTTSRPEIDAQGSAKFQVPPKPATYEALDKMIYALHDIMRSPVPGLYFWFMKRMPSYSKAYAIKEALIHDELEKGIARANQGDTTERCALDNILLREVRAAKKEGRSASYHTRSIYDEVSSLSALNILDLTIHSYSGSC